MRNGKPTTPAIIGYEVVAVDRRGRRLGSFHCSREAWDRWANHDQRLAFVRQGLPRLRGRIFSYQYAKVWGLK